MIKDCYFVSLGAQKKIIDKWCFGKCGKICIGALNIEGGMFLPCGQKKCPIVDEEVDLKQITHTNENIIIRKLKDTQDKRGEK